MVVAERERAELLAEALPASVVVSAGAIAIAAPIAERAGEPGKLQIVGGHGPAFAEGDVMGGIEGERGQVAEGADVPAAELRPQGVAAVLDQPEIVLRGTTRPQPAALKGTPMVWAIITPRVLGPMAAAIASSVGT